MWVNSSCHWRWKRSVLRKTRSYVIAAHLSPVPVFLSWCHRVFSFFFHEKTTLYVAIFFNPYANEKNNAHRSPELRHRPLVYHSDDTSSARLRELRAEMASRVARLEVCRWTRTLVEATAKGHSPLVFSSSAFALICFALLCSHLACWLLYGAPRARWSLIFAFLPLLLNLFKDNIYPILRGTTDLTGTYASQLFHSQSKSSPSPFSSNKLKIVRFAIFLRNYSFR